jgi:hypothetical protein
VQAEDAESDGVPADLEMKHRAVHAGRIVAVPAHERDDQAGGGAKLQDCVGHAQPRRKQRQRVAAFVEPAVQREGHADVHDSDDEEAVDG